MGLCLMSRKGGSVKFNKKTLEAFGFTNVPDGEWIMKTGTKSATNIASNIIPLVVNVYLSGIGASNQSAKLTDNLGNTYSSYGFGSNSNSGWVKFCEWLPSYQDLTVLKNVTSFSYTKGSLSISVWLEEVGGVIRQLITYLANIGKEVLA